MKSKSGNFKRSIFLFLIFSFSSLFSSACIFKNLDSHFVSIDVISSHYANDISVSYREHYLLLTVGITDHSSMYSDTTKRKDKDGDGVTDSLDKCPDEKGVLLYDGCPVPDSDNDGISDESDACPTVAGILKYKGCPAGDTDGDKIDDEIDRCPDLPGVARFGGCLIGDKDGDGLNDDVDKCIDVAGIVENQGCPGTRKNVPTQRKDKKIRR